MRILSVDEELLLENMHGSSRDTFQMASSTLDQLHGTGIGLQVFRTFLLLKNMV